MILISSCLLGNAVRYDGKAKGFPLLEKYKNCGHFIPICPETAGNLAIPRPPAEIQNGNGDMIWNNKTTVKDITGKDVTKNFKDGALFYQQFFKDKNISALILKERSPSCGTHFIHDGSFTNSIISGMGVATSFFKTFGLPIYSEEEITEDILLQLLKKDIAYNKK